MKFLALVFFVCAANAATFPYNTARASAYVSSPVAVVEQAAYKTAEVVRPVVNNDVYNVKTVRSGNDFDATVLKSVTDVHPEGFNYAYETSNGIAANAEGTVKNANNVPTLEVRGQYTYRNADGKDVTVTYIANENGFQPDNLPVGPEIPEAIVRSLEYIRAHPQKEDVYKKN